jgi:hypothetical protein
LRGFATLSIDGDYDGRWHSSILPYRYYLWRSSLLMPVG